MTANAPLDTEVLKGAGKRLILATTDFVEAVNVVGGRVKGPSFVHANLIAIISAAIALCSLGLTIWAYYNTRLSDDRKNAHNDLYSFNQGKDKLTSENYKRSLQDRDYVEDIMKTLSRDRFALSAHDQAFLFTELTALDDVNNEIILFNLIPDQDGSLTLEDQFNLATQGYNIRKKVADKTKVARMLDALAGATTFGSLSDIQKAEIAIDQTEWLESEIDPARDRDVVETIIQKRHVADETLQKALDSTKKNELRERLTKLPTQKERIAAPKAASTRPNG